jgi:DsbC/DsbD-like thiol-disulfide interchange protein
MTICRSIKPVFAIAGLVLLAAPQSGLAQGLKGLKKLDAQPLAAGGGLYDSRWIKTPFSRARLITAQLPVHPHRPAANLGVQIAMGADWKTYWRTPGDSGVPPQFTWDKSENLKSVTVHWPAPVRFSDEYGISIGYKDKVVFPVTVTPRDAGKPVKVHLKLDYAACKEICVPTQAVMKLTIDPGNLFNSPHRRLLADYAARVPYAGAMAGLARVKAATVRRGAKPAVLIDVQPGKPSRAVALYLEGPRAFYFGHPALAPGAPQGLQRYLVPVDGVSAKQPLKGTVLKVTLVEAEHASEQVVTVK